MEVLTDFPERIQIGKSVYVGPARQTLVIRSLRWHGERLLIAFEGFDDRDAAGALRNQWVAVRVGDQPELPQGEFYHHQLIGLQVVDEGGHSLGSIEEILETGANDVLIVRSADRGQILLPMIDSVVLDVDLALGQMRVHLLPGLE
jgi:16S rRNA processing protein RimM